VFRLYIGISHYTVGVWVVIKVIIITQFILFGCNIQQRHDGYIETIKKSYDSGYDHGYRIACNPPTAGVCIDRCVKLFFEKEEDDYRYQQFKCKDKDKSVYEHLNDMGGDLVLGTKSRRSSIRLENNGDIYIRNKLIANDLDVYKGMKEFLKIAIVEAREFECKSRRSKNAQ